MLKQMILQEISQVENLTEEVPESYSTPYPPHSSSTSKVDLSQMLLMPLTVVCFWKRFVRWDWETGKYSGFTSTCRAAIQSFSNSQFKVVHR